MHPLMRKMTAEFIGTFGLIFFGGGAAAMGKPLIDIALANGLAIMIAAYVCAVQRHGLSAGANPARQLSLQPVAIGAVVEVTKRLKPPV